MLYAKLAAAVLQRTTEDTDPKFWLDANPLIAFLYGSAALLSYYFLCFSPIFFTNTPSIPKYFMFDFFDINFDHSSY
jgi:hypothetical protein